MYRLPAPLTCTACRMTWADSPAPYPPSRLTFTTIIVCVGCGHAMALQPPFLLRDLTRAEADALQRDASLFAQVRQMQERVCSRMWG